MANNAAGITTSTATSIDGSSVNFSFEKIVIIFRSPEIIGITRYLNLTDQTL